MSALIEKLTKRILRALTLNCEYRTSRRKHRKPLKTETVDMAFGFIMLGGLLLIFGIFLKVIIVSIAGSIFYYAGFAVAVLGIALLIYEALHLF